jgi:S1-C subfamily serine protease
LISNYHVVKDATKVRLLTSAGLIGAKVVQVDAANDLALLKANAEGGMKNEETIIKGSVPSKGVSPEYLQPTVGRLR